MSAVAQKFGAPTQKHAAVGGCSARRVTVPHAADHPLGLPRLHGVSSRTSTSSNPSSRADSAVDSGGRNSRPTRLVRQSHASRCAGTVSSRARFCLPGPFPTRCPESFVPLYRRLSGLRSVGISYTEAQRRWRWRKPCRRDSRLYVIVVRRCAGAGAAERRAALLRRRVAEPAHLPGLGSAAVRPVLPAPRHHLRPAARACTSCRRRSAVASWWLRIR